ncbi:crosslink repair DNA glycosylase YcaQ family protein [Microbacterium sp. M3]|uniref:Crosslink repair DNA glycosylase YcaQ family protein n=1 Tax=Microbacterium arthrosphaerae TaxID=792652 RepID=A0ABU4GXQ7_9MICO|nr:MULTISPECIES: crosslink repair DNA glycosylase YcaQ family protein [Microbacterium]MDW4571229.1 crosslink repair DNA glycosylase YcaQ family protein [Microbacterium arthrosphaerae]MDW7605084.1 crosslink repair DNA glycosylase YcaQ family protein [Microbacterium sp. M3]
MVLRLTAEQARRIAVRAQLLTAERPAGIVETIDALTVVNIEPTAAIAPSADLILWSRLGWPYQPADLVRLVERDRAVFEWGGFYRTMADLALLLPEMRRRPESIQAREWLAANDVFRRDVIARLRAEGPLHAADIPDAAQVPWRSSGWTNNRNSLQLLEILVLCGEVAVSSRDAAGRLFDVADRVYPADVPVLSDEDAARERAQRRLAALGVARAKAAQSPEPIDVGEIGEAAVVEGVEGEWRVDPAALEAGDGFAARTALLSPFDRLVFDRKRLTELFGYGYLLEMYKPAAQRRWGYFALPILHGDRFIGKLDAKADRKAGVLRVHAVHEDVPFTEDTSAAVHSEIERLAQWLGLEVTEASR